MVYELGDLKIKLLFLHQPFTINRDTEEWRSYVELQMAV